MPIVRIDIQAGKTTAYKREILHAVRSAITESLGVADERVTQRIIETPAENIDVPEARSDRMTVIEIAMLPGRDASHKQALYTALVAHLGDSPGIHQHDITVLVSDPAAECFAIGGAMQCTLPGAPGPEEDDEPEVAAVSYEPADEIAAIEPEPDDAPTTDNIPAENPEA